MCVEIVALLIYYVYGSSISFYMWPNQGEDMTQTLKDCLLQ